MSAPDRCYHCDLPLPHDARWSVTIDGVARPMCCPGCQAVASSIVNGGLQDFYRLRTEPATRPTQGPEKPSPYALPEVARRYVGSTGDGYAQVSLLISGITCAACVWLLEHALQRLDGVHGVLVNFSTRRARVTFDANNVCLPEILTRIRTLGYEAHPYDPARHESLLQSERKQRLKRLGVAGLLGMQIMMLATALYFGEHGGIDPLYRAVLRWTSLLLCVPVVLYCAAPFFRKAWHSLRRGHAGMDLPVSLGIGIAFAGSVVATWAGTGEVYFESVA
ncbi:MAG: heavy metal translocating P-type ATPase metal-binding domain-containing protein, partial [Saprospiraceae bacterium]|nr:heavy metal translocating P-type ATPase metal-binding domain-containing protein [Saprospiraceae bacterium]